jgi:ketosteroid isomerase-like protein
MIKYRFLLIFCLVFAMSGCAGNKMALTKGKSDINLTKKSIALLSVRISNQYKPNRQLELLSVVICPQSEPNCRHDLLSNPGSPYKPYKRKKRHFNEYLLSYELESGTFNVDSFYTTYQIPALISGFGFAKLNLKTEIKPNSISYLGHLDIILREKKNDAEMRAGAAVPFIDQSIAGFSSGTFDVVVEDKFDEDMKSFISEYPALKKVEVEKSILPQWIRPEKEAVVAPKVEETVTPKEAVVAPKVEETVTPKQSVAAPKVEEPATPVADAKVKEPAASNEVVTAAAAPVVTTENLAPVDIKQNETKSIPEEAVRNLVTKWLTSWKSGDMKTYRSCYTSDFQSKVMNLDAWISYKNNVRQRSKKIKISINDLQISADENIATAVFTQHYSSAILKYSGKKKLELRKINNEWKIYKEIM